MNIYGRGHTLKAWVLQMPDRPGFDRFLMRLERLGLTYNTYEIDEKVFQLVERMIHVHVVGNSDSVLSPSSAVGVTEPITRRGCKNAIASDIDDFRLIIIQKRTG